MLRRWDRDINDDFVEDVTVGQLNNIQVTEQKSLAVIQGKKMRGQLRQALKKKVEEKQAMLEAKQKISLMAMSRNEYASKLDQQKTDAKFSNKQSALKDFLATGTPGKKLNDPLTRRSARQGTHENPGQLTGRNLNEHLVPDT